MQDDLALLRRRIEELAADLDRLLGHATAGTAALVAQVASASAAGTMFALHSVGIACGEEEGDAPSFTPAATTIHGLHLGTTAPTVGAYVIVVQIGGLWQFAA